MLDTLDFTGSGALAPFKSSQSTALKLTNKYASYQPCQLQTVHHEVYKKKEREKKKTINLQVHWVKGADTQYKFNTLTSN